MKKAKMIIMWVLSVFMILVSLAYFPSITSIMALVFAVIAAPIGKLQEFLSEAGLRGWIKGVVLCVTFIAAIAVAPTSKTGHQVDQPLPEPSYRGTLPRQKPTQEPAQAQNPAETGGPAETWTAAQTEEPVGTQTPENRTTEPTEKPAQNQAQPGNAETIKNSDGTYTHDFSGGRMLGTINSDKYHYRDCRAAKTIPPENCVWYGSEDEAKADGRSRCGICWR